MATSAYTYDTLNRLTALDHKQSTTDLALYDYTYDFMDRIATMTHNVDGVSTFTYDKESQVTAADHANPRSDESFTFDSTGNRTGGSYTVTTNNRTTADATYSYTYDNEGNRATRTKVSNDYVTEYSWDHRNRLIGVTEKDDMASVLSTVEYYYDAFNRLVRRAYDADGPGGNDPTDQFFAYDGGSINPVLDFAGTEDTDLAHRNLWAEAVDQIMATEDVTSLGSAGNALWPLPDHQGTIRDVADLNEGSGVTSVTNHLTFDAFGILSGETNGSVEFAFGFMGKPHDDATGLVYYVSRWYDPFLGKWLSPDPLGFASGDLNLVCMVGNNVLNLIDPFGLTGTMPALTSADTFSAAYASGMQAMSAYTASMVDGDAGASSWSSMVPSANTMHGVGNLWAVSPFLALTGTSRSDVAMMAPNPITCAWGGAGGLADGGLIIVNNGANIAASSAPLAISQMPGVSVVSTGIGLAVPGGVPGLIDQFLSPFNDYVDAKIADGGPLYVVADWSAWISVNALQMAAGSWGWQAAALPTYTIAWPKGHVIYNVTTRVPHWRHLPGWKWIGRTVTTRGLDKSVASVGNANSLSGIPILFPRAATTITSVGGPTPCLATAVRAFLAGWGF